MLNFAYGVSAINLSRSDSSSFIRASRASPVSRSVIVHECSECKFTICTYNTNIQIRHMSEVKRQVYNPVAQFKSAEEKEAARVIWETASVQMAYAAVDQGLPLRSNPWFFGNIALRKPGLLYRYTDIELREWLRCKYDIIYYANNYVTLLTPAGTRMHITLRPYQKRALRAYQRNKMVIQLTGRQVGKTTTAAIFLSWAVIFNRELNIAVLGDRLATSSENLNKTKDIINNLPFFMKPGVFVWNGGMVAFDNGCKIIIGKHHGGSILCHLGPGDSHCDTDVRLL